MKERISAALIAKYSTLKPYQIEKSVDKYVTVMLSAIAESVRKFGFEDDQVSLSLDDIAKLVGRIKIKGKDFKVSTLFNADRNTSLVIVDFPGQIGKIARVSLNPVYQTEIMQALAKIDAPVASAGSEDRAANIYTSIDLLTLDSFIENTKDAYMTACQKTLSSNENYRKALLRNLLNARHIKSSITEEDGQYVFAEYWEQSDSGRCYGHGTSLQRVSKEVRHAALGRCHMYDVKAASYALLTGLALEIDPTLDVDVLVDYVSHRSRIRKAIAADVGINEEKMKEIFTSLGFGAKTANNPFASIRKTLGETAYCRLMVNDQFVRIGDAMNMVRETIAGHFPDSFEFLGRHYDSVCPRTGKTRKKDQKLAWIYQAMEAEAITRFGVDAAEAGYQPLLFVHDCVYFKHKLPEAVLSKITNDLQKTFPLLEADYEGIYPIHTDDFIDPVYAQEAKRIEQHKALIRQLSGDAMSPEPVQTDTSPWHEEFAGWMAMSDVPDFSKFVSVEALPGGSIDLGRSIDLWHACR
ncbi:hypothetical protein [Duganella sp. P38]|uniref:hypothetical protein n=1 Tax=Duganella sp. P38 TaxID=3423949 RepID=UPI003D7A4C24